MSVARLVDLVTPKATSVDDAVALYIRDRKDGKGERFEDLAWLAHSILVEVAGSKDLESYKRSDARAFMSALSERGAKTATIRRWVGTIKAIFEHAFRENDIEKRNPFARLQIPGEGLDATKRGTFTSDQLSPDYS